MSAVKHLKRFIVASLERTCSWVWDPIFNRFDTMAWLAYDVLDIPICRLALLSYKLDERWGTGYWVAPDGEKDDVGNAGELDK